MSTINPYESPKLGQIPADGQARLPVRATGILLPDDGIAALKAVGKWPTWRGWTIILGFLIVVSLVTGLSIPQNGPVVGATVGAIGLVLYVSLLVSARPRFAKMWNSRPEHMQPMTWTFAEDGLFVETANSKHLHQWTSFLYFKATSNQLIIAQQGDMQFNFVPKRMFADETDWETVQNLLAAKLAARKL